VGHDWPVDEEEEEDGDGEDGSWKASALGMGFGLRGPLEDRRPRPRGGLSLSSGC
jgi:hypothetical protein